MLISNIILTFSRQTFNILAYILFWIILARILGPQGTGEFTVAILLPTLLNVLLNFGIPSANVYLIGRGDIAISTALRRSVLAALAIGVLGLCGSAVIIIAFSESLFPGVRQVVLWIAIGIFPVIVMNAFLASIFQGQQKFKKLNAVQLLPAIISLVGAVILVWALHLGPVGAVISWGLGQLGALGAATWFLVTDRDVQPTKEVQKSYTREWLSYGWKSHLANLSAFLMYRTDVYLINLFVGPIAVGIFAVAVHIAERLWTFSFAVSTVLFPKLSELHKDEAKRRRITPMAARWVIFLTSIFAIPLALLIKIIIEVLFGAEYADSGNVVLVLLPGIVVFACARVLCSDIAARGQPVLNILVGGTTFTVNVIANLILIPRYGVIGAAVGTSMAYFAGTIVCLGLYGRLSGNTWWRPLRFERADWDMLWRVIPVLQKSRRQ